jgi:hypothetical protein
MTVNIFEINNLNNIQIETFQDSKIYTMDNFYKYPEEILNYLLYTHAPSLWKECDTPSFNGIHFLDLRHKIDDLNFKNVGIQLSNICNQTAHSLGTVKTNFIKFLNKEFNDYSNNYWAPHFDMGYTAIIYLNSVDAATNIYEQLEDDKWTSPEHFEPWRSKQKYKIIKQLRGRFNRLVMFDGAKFLHGMDISNDDFFKFFRMNQVLFLKESRT